MDKRVYKIQGKRFTQSELTLRQDKELFKLWKEAGVSLEGLGSVQDVGGVLEKLIEGDLLERFLAIILNGPREEVNWAEVPNSVVVEVLSDFFALNAGWLKRFRGWLEKLGMTLK